MKAQLMTTDFSNREKSKIKATLKSICAVVAMLVLVSTAHANVVVYHQGFETDIDGIIGNGEGAEVTRVASGGGTLGVTSAAGSYHAEVKLGGTYGFGFYTQNGGYSDTWPGYMKQSIKVYIDPAAGNVDDGWFWDAAICDEDGTSWAGGGGFGVRKTASDTWSLGAEDAYGGFHYVGETRAPHDNTTPLELTTAGWYTLATEWVVSSTDSELIDQVNTVRDAGGNLLWEDTVGGYMSLTADAVSRAYKNSVAGGMSYSWLGSQASEDESGYDPHPYEETTLYAPANTMALLAVDDVHAAILPEPGTLILLLSAGLGALAYAWRRRQS